MFIDELAKAFHLKHLCLTPIEEKKVFIGLISLYRSRISFSTQTSELLKEKKSVSARTRKGSQLNAV